MIEQIATVIAFENNRCLVESEQQSSCGNCAQVKQCATGNVQRYFGKKTQQLWITAPDGLEIGDKITIGIDEQCLVGASFRVYIIPLLAFFVGIIGVYLAFPTLPELFQLLSGILFAFVTLQYLKRRNYKNVDTSTFEPIFIKKQEQPLNSTLNQIKVKTEL